MLKRMRAALVVLVVLAFAGCGTPQNIFSPKGADADKINKLQVPVFIAAAAVGVIVFGLLGWIILHDRRRARRDDVEPEQVHGNSRLEIAWTILPVVILVFVAVPTVFTLAAISKRSSDSVKINVYGQQWWWSYEYDLNGDGRPEIITANELVIPVDKKVELQVHSRDVIHSFWIPALGGTRDAVPGRTQLLEIEASQAGTYFEGQCKEYCGLSHANMRARAIALDQREYDQWVRDQSQPAATPPVGTAAAAGLDTFKQKCASCHEIRNVDNLHGNAPLVSGYAPDLTHLMSREVFASATYSLWVPEGDCTKEQYDARQCKLTFNRSQLEAWLRDPGALLPMAADQGRGMPNLHLTERDIDSIVSYLETLGPFPQGAVNPSEEGK